MTRKSAWGYAWAKSWGNSWGVPTESAAIVRAKHPEIYGRRTGHTEKKRLPFSTWWPSRYRPPR